MSRGFRRVTAYVFLFVAGVFVGSGLLMSYLAPSRIASGQGGDGVATFAPTPTILAEAVYAEVEALDHILINMYQRVNISVVHITSRSEQIDLFYGVVPQEGTGSGFIYDTQGHIITNYHVIEGAAEIDVVLANGETLPAQIVGVDQYYDLAVLRVNASPGILVPLELGDSSSLRVGQTVIAIGNPFGLDRTMTRGLVSALGRRVETERGAIIGQAIQTDAAINPGNSGGPLLDLRGRVVGINTAINSPTGGSVGIGFAVPANVVRRVVPELIAQGRYPHPTIGATLAELGTEVTPPRDGPQRGLLIVQLEPGGPGASAGLVPAEVRIQRRRYVFSGGDIIVAVGGKPVSTRNDLFLALDENYRAGDTVDITIVRDGQRVNIPVVLGAS